MANGAKYSGNGVDKETHTTSTGYVFSLMRPALVYALHALKRICCGQHRGGACHWGVLIGGFRLVIDDDSFPTLLTVPSKRPSLVGVLTFVKTPPTWPHRRIAPSFKPLRQNERGSGETETGALKRAWEAFLDVTVVLTYNLEIIGIR